MTEDEYTELLKDRFAEPRVYTSDFDGADRTLLYGMTTKGLTWHVYLKDSHICRLTYTGNEARACEHATDFRADLLIPSKVVFPEATDHQMAQRLQELGVSVPYAPFNVTRRDYYAELERDRGAEFLGLLPTDF
jgi:hypothetical protein